MTAKLLPLGVAVVAASQLGATDCGQAISNQDFNLWCGSGLCSWVVERGTVAKVPSWNEGDPAVSLVGSDTAIYQLSPVSSSDSNCLDFDMIANVGGDAEVTLVLDLNGDGNVEYSQRIPSSSWKPISFQIPLQGVFSGIRFEIDKQGNGSAVLAQIEAHIGSDCGGLPPVTVAPSGLGAYCDPAAGITCAGSLACYSSSTSTPSEDTCAKCTDSSECVAFLGSGWICGLGAPISPLLAVPIECLPPASAHSKLLGEQCLTSAECGTAFCTDGVCSACGSDADCGSGQHCAADWSPPAGLPTGLPYFGAPWTCAAGQGLAPNHSSCGDNADCASHNCVGGPLNECDDGRACTSDADCPFGTWDTPNPLANGPCRIVGIEGGTCQ